jgi:hypothetical protein
MGFSRDGNLLDCEWQIAGPPITTAPPQMAVLSSKTMPMLQVEPVFPRLSRRGPRLSSDLSASGTIESHMAVVLTVPTKAKPGFSISKVC